MRNLKDIINEGRISAFEIKKYAKMAITNSTNYKQYVDYLVAANEGIREGIVENCRYYDGSELEDAEKFGAVMDELMDILNKNLK